MGFKIAGLDPDLDTIRVPGMQRGRSDHRIAGTDRLVSVPTSGYFTDTYSDPRFRNCLLWRRFSVSSKTVSADVALARLFSLRASSDLPRMLNCFCHKELIQLIRTRTGRVFRPPCPDYAFAAAVLALVRDFKLVSVPTFVAGIAHETIGDSFGERRDGPALEFVREFGEVKIFKHVPIEALVCINVIAASLALVRETMSVELASKSVDWVSYFTQCFHELLYLEDRGVDVRAELEELRAALSRQPRTIRVQVRLRTAAMSLYSPRIRTRIRTLVDSSQVLSRMTSGVLGRHLTHGHANGFRNIVEAAKYLEGCYSPTA